ncbi:MAG: hypothetical protein ACJ8G3_25995 [Burkholderiaceae bacterium]
MNRDTDTRSITQADADDRAAQPTIVHETVPGEDPIVQGGDPDAREKGGKSTADEDI